MAERFEYTTRAQRYTARFPILTYVSIQVNFWVMANILLVTVIHFFSLIVREVYQTQVAGSFIPLLMIAIIMGIFYGVSLGLAEYYLDRTYFKRLSLGKLILFKGLISLTLLTLVLVALRFFLFGIVISPFLSISDIRPNQKSWDYLFSMLLIYYFFMTLIISFINQVNRKYGPGVLLPLLLGRYRNPKEEERIFMFMDLKSSTSTAEKLGHLKYSSFIRDCFSDINEVLFPFCAQIYQYVGDEVVVMWPSSEGLKNQFCLEFFFACKKQFEIRAEYYRANYGFLPVFKAGLHMGKVTAVEIGEIKKDIAYHGDTLNTTARIQSVCNDYNRDFLVSEYLMEKIGAVHTRQTEHLGLILLRGKAEKVGIVSVI